MTIKQQGGVFGRNPTFNNLSAIGITNLEGAVSLGNNLTVSSNQPDIIAIDENATAGFAGNRQTIDAGNYRMQTLTATGGFVSNDYMVDKDASGAIKHAFRIGNSEKLAVISTGDTKLTNGNLVIGTSGKGIDFSATAGTGTSELFDDYEEGTWTPVISDATSGGNIGSSTVAYATYTKIGNVVHLKARLLNMNTTGMGTGNMYIQGLPFTASGDNDGISTTSFFTAAANSLGVFPSVDNGTSYLKLKEVISGDVYINADTAQFASGTADIWITITYHAG